LSATLVRLINAARKPTIYGDRDFVAAGGLVFYGFDIDDAFRLVRSSSTACSRARIRRRHRSSNPHASLSSSISRRRVRLV
jgi:hypothetical protein